MDATRAIEEAWWLDEAEPAMDRPPLLAADERRMQVRAYNRWLSKLRGRSYPSVADFTPDEADFSANCVLLDFSAGPANPVVVRVGAALATECSAQIAPQSVAEVPSRSLLSRLTDHYLQIIANRAPIGFEAEFVSQRGHLTLYRGVLMPLSSDDAAIDYIYGVINWKELADGDVAADLELEIGRAWGSGAPDRAVEAPTPWDLPDAFDADSFRRAAGF